MAIWHEFKLYRGEPEVHWLTAYFLDYTTGYVWSKKKMGARRFEHREVEVQTFPGGTRGRLNDGREVEIKFVRPETNFRR